MMVDEVVEVIRVSMPVIPSGKGCAAGEIER